MFAPNANATSDSSNRLQLSRELYIIFRAVIVVRIFIIYPLSPNPSLVLSGLNSELGLIFGFFTKRDAIPNIFTKRDAIPIFFTKRDAKPDCSVGWPSTGEANRIVA